MPALRTPLPLYLANLNKSLSPRLNGRLKGGWRSVKLCDLSVTRYDTGGLSDVNRGAWLALRHPSRPSFDGWA